MLRALNKVIARRREAPTKQSDLRLLRRFQRLAKTGGPLLSAALLILAYPGFNLGLLAWAALIPLFFSLEDKKPGQRFITGYVFGVIFFSGILYWLVNVTVPGAIVLVALLAFAPALFCFLFTKHNARYATLMIPSAWVLTEYLRSHLFTGFPWALLAYSQSFNLPVIQIADITGPYGVSFLIVLVNLGIYLVFKKTPKRFYALFFILILFGSVLIYGQNRMRQVFPAKSLKVAIIQGNIPQNQKWDPRHREFIIDKYISLTERALDEDPALVIWPETSVPGYLEGEADLRGKVTGLARFGKTNLLAGTLREEDRNPKIFNSATLISEKGKVLKSYDKIHLVPFGEFVPFENAIYWLRNIIDKPIGDFERGGEFTVFDFRRHSAIFEPAGIHKTTEFHKFSALICFEDIFPDLARNFVKRGAKFLVNITNDAWFGKTSAPYQHMQGSIFRAVENRVPVLRAANTGVSCIIDHTGRVTKYVRSAGRETFVDGYVVGIIRPVFVKTIYTRFGDVFSWICIAVALFGFAPIFVKQKSAMRKPTLILIAFLAFSLTAYAAEEIHYRGKLKLKLPFGKKIRL
jgi:apolipoprotein N-acyltransferase